jgi:hypothetical protein
MAQVYFHYVTTLRGQVVAREGTVVDGLTDARNRAAGAIQALVNGANQEDWRGWVLHASDATGEEIFSVPFATILGKAH